MSDPIEPQNPMIPPQAAAIHHVGLKPSYSTLAVVSWILLGLTMLVSVIPVLGFFSWIVAAPVFLATLIMGIMILSRGGTMQGILVLLATVVVAPAFIVCAPLLTTVLLGAAMGVNDKTTTDSTISASATPSADSSAASITPNPEVSPSPSASASPEDEDAKT